MSAALSWSPPIFPFVRLPDVVGFRSGPSEEVDPRLYVSGISSRDDAYASPLLIRCSTIGYAPPFLSELSSGDMPIACGPFAVILASTAINWFRPSLISPNQPVTSGTTFLVAILCRAWT